MNLVLLTPEEINKPLEWTDTRATHIRDILRLVPGERLRCGLVGGAAGTALLIKMDETGCHLGDWEWEGPTPEPYPLSFIIGTPRPPTARRLLKDLTTLGAGELHFCSTDLGEKSYLQSHLWTRQEYVESLREGAMQGGVTHLPKVFTHTSLFKALKAQSPHSLSFYFDFGYPQGLPAQLTPGLPIVLALGPERGWSDRERRILDESGWMGRSLGSDRILRTETAAIAAAALALERSCWKNS